ncbi:MAG: hypothetical protein HYT88_02090 [Candidatus Omnitrophica bacterium]|nr:hypothetical protein [Candidatus Omnitrophota bacterium]
MLTMEAFNALLKTLEEPPAHVKFIFATTVASKIPGTILSRCQRFDFRRMDMTTLVATLKKLAQAERIEISEAALFSIARAADGSLRDAEVALEQASSFAKGKIEEDDVAELLGSVESEALFAWGQAILERNATQTLQLLLAQLDQGRDAPQLLMSLLRHFRNLLIVSSTAASSSKGELRSQLVDEPEERLIELEKQAQSFSEQELLLILQMLNGAYDLVRRSPMGRLVLEMVLLKLATREQWQSLEQISRRLEAMQDPARVHVSEASEQAAATVEPSSDVITSEGEGVRLEAIVSLWPEFLEKLGQQKMSLSAYLADSRPVALKENVLTVGLPSFSLHQEVLSHSDNRKLITNLLNSLCQSHLTITYTTLTESPSEQLSKPSTTTPAAAPTVVQDIVKMFNATLIDRPRTA